MKFKPLLLSLAMAGACSQATADAISQHTYANLDDVTTTHLLLDLDVDFDDKQLEGFVEHTLDWHNATSKTLVLDTRDLDIDKVMYQDQKGSWHKADFTLAARDDVKGSKLTIKFKSQAVKARIYYNSRPEASGLQWLTPEQTASKSHPFMYSQSQAIHARSWIPVQDTPAMRVTYSARIHTPKDIRAVMSADNKDALYKDGDYLFNMPQPISPYLIAIGAGNLEFKAMSKQTGIFAEPTILDASVAEFNDTQAMIDKTNAMYGEYAWGRYDLLMLPPSFPFGGMENPRLSFITPTVVAGDKSLVNLIAHELAHSWSGNLVTNATWEDLWLNEGFTSYVENRIMEEVFGRDRAVMEQALDAAGLRALLKTLPAPDTRLNLKLNGRDPDDAFSSVPYTKGQLFLIYLENKFGRDKFDPFVKGYFDQFAFKSLTTAQFVTYLKANLIEKYPGVVSMDKVNEWIFEPGLPSDAPNPTSDAFDKVDAVTKTWLNGEISAAQLPTADWSVHEWLHFLNNLPRDLSIEKMAELDNQFNLTQSTNAERAFAWFMLAVGNGYQPIYPALDEHLSGIGRRKLIVPLYKALIKNGKKDWAHDVYLKARPGYHPLAQGTVDDLFAK
ncbi:aminopeptidase [Pseudoalteromonas sp. S4488]|uniref:M1 family metallopeptidase n=1 Tax=unclassified Pseudoalteromonas TaxID=194690 RepID=UPI001022B9FD|nr:MULTISPECIES: M1 family metallopeptidase [unclassified Pseudoalteromonas]RZF77551.1 M1 family peptidase [Pseudoalteromonas sp. CO109Y]TMO32731.1 aminopeptidase [Pseudoalteromonas sp. S4491]TMO39673.1 aminopeptidase [Pseudoalteromonas sp. S4488]